MTHYIDQEIDVRDSQKVVAKDRKRISIIYNFGGLFCFNLIKKEPYDKPTLWQGEIGEIKDFNIKSFNVATL